MIYSPPAFADSICIWYRVITLVPLLHVNFFPAKITFRACVYEDIIMFVFWGPRQLSLSGMYTSDLNLPNYISFGKGIATDPFLVV